jgi:arylsulfatase A-like enzyme
MNALAARGTSFERAYSTSSFTSLSLPGLLAARLPSTIEMQWFAAFAGIPTEPVGGLAPMLAARGYDTGFVGGAAGRRYFDEDVFGNGFRVQRPLIIDAPPEALTAAAIATWKTLDPSRPRFLYVHSMWMHEPHGDFDGYTRAASRLDAGLGAIRKAIGDTPLWIITADHGQEFGEHGGTHHARTLYGEVMRVPLILTGAGLPATRVKTVTSLRAVMPTLITMVAPDAAPDGLGPYLCLGQAQCRDMDAPMALELRHTHWHGLVRGNHSIYRHLDVDRVLAFDLAADPAERRPLDVIPPQLERSLRDWEQQAFGAPECTWPY